MGTDVLAVGAHPDDVELSAGGTVAKLVAEGFSVVILDLTRGERASRGTPERRREEAEKAARVLGARRRIILDMGDAVLEDNMDNRKLLVETIREVRPRLVLAPYWEDTHPDHAAAGRMVRDSIYPSGFRNFPAAGAPHRPQTVLFYMCHKPFIPDLVVDVSDHMKTKMAAIREHHSQFDPPSDGETETRISSPRFLPMIEAKARYYGEMIGREFGEPFALHEPLPVRDFRILMKRSE